MSTHVPASLNQLIREMRVKATIPADAPSLTAMIFMTADDRKTVLKTCLGMQKVGHRSRVMKRLDQIKKILLENPEIAVKHYLRCVEDSKEQDYAALIQLSHHHDQGTGGLECNSLRALTLKQKAQKTESFKKWHKETPDKDEMKEIDKDTWQVRIEFRNGHHSVVRTLNLDLIKLPETMGVRSFVDPHMMPALKEMKWKGFGLWCGHEAVTEDTEFRDLAYQRTYDGFLLLQCEDHNCRYRPILVPQTTSPECVVCHGKNDFGGMLACMHKAACKKCWPKLDNCPVCGKRRPKKGMGARPIGDASQPKQQAEVAKDKL
uniref:RING-type domain-containing protein n=1 Tax=Lotharella globosa TaxID=91324 RepID=A0A7S3Z7N4_9EUKA|mmetsp:Transcript_16170/g.32770  ORF Transcript_16170/g.32770 Transcript_16170/m.32770 type:complete len:319 (-) Transcript_16170:25-981(-)